MDCKEKKNEPIIFGVDIGIASVGWGVLTTDRILDVGVRCFNRAETTKGESLNLIRRTARLARRRLKRRASRLKALSRLFFDEGMIADSHFFMDQKNIHSNIGTVSPWILRCEGLKRTLSGTEWAYVLYHICKHRGFYWVSKAEERVAEADAKGETGKVKKGLAAIAQLMETKGYRTIAELILAEFPDAQRNKQAEYTKSISRILLATELDILFKQQKNLGNPYTSDRFKESILGNGDRKSGIFWQQEPALAGDALLKMLGKCTFEKQEYRAPRNSFTAERHVWFTRLNNLRIWVNGVLRPLSETERNLIINAPYQQATDLTYEKVRKILVEAGQLETEEFRFQGLKYHVKSDKDEVPKNPEKAVLCKLSGWHAIRKLLTDAQLQKDWQIISGQALAGNPTMLDQIAWVLTIYKEDDDLFKELQSLLTNHHFDNATKITEALLALRFSEFSNLSLKALYQIVPHMQQGKRYDEAIAAIPDYLHHSKLINDLGLQSKYLPSLYTERSADGRMCINEEMNVPRNPVVLRALNQARKVLNALVKKYGSPHEVHIEMARDLSRPFDERQQIEKAQKQFQESKESDKQAFAATFNIIGEVKGRDFEKYRLYREQSGKCAYSVQGLDIDRLLEPGYVEIDHVLPYSKTFDDSKNNKVLVLIKENQNKGNRTPYEYLDGQNDSEAWRIFEGFTQSNVQYTTAKRNRLLRQHISIEDKKEFLERNLNDTRYICRFFKNYVETYLQLHPDSSSKRCVVVSGQLTAFLRTRWGFAKIREANDRHHALDAIIVAACNHSLVKRLSDYSRRKELQYVKKGFVDTETGEILDPKAFEQLEKDFPKPWDYFRDEVLARVFSKTTEDLHSALQKIPKYSSQKLDITPLFVSRAPQRRNSGAAHKETIYSQSESLKKKAEVIERIALKDLKENDLDHLVDPHRNEKLYQAIRERLEAFSFNAKKAFTAENPLYKPSNTENILGPKVTSVKVIRSMTGIPVREGIAKNDTMIRIDIFKKDKSFFIIPLYVHHQGGHSLPNRAIVSGKKENDWLLIDDSFSFCFSLYPNDYVRIEQKNRSLEGYYGSCDRATASINLWQHDRESTIGENGLIRSIGIKTALSIEKFHVDVLGNLYPIFTEERHGLA